jgi:hypothetical protein
MKIRVLGFAVALGACAHQGRIQVDTPILTYKAPDISEITGIDEDDTDAADKGSAAAPAPAPAPAPGAKPATPPAK